MWKERELWSHGHFLQLLVYGGALHVALSVGLSTSVQAKKTREFCEHFVPFSGSFII